MLTLAPTTNISFGGFRMFSLGLGTLARPCLLQRRERPRRRVRRPRALGRYFSGRHRVRLFQPGMAGGLKTWGWTLCIVASISLPLGHAAQALTLADMAQFSTANAHGPFGAIELQAKSLLAPPKWRRLFEKLRLEEQALARCAENEAYCASAELKLWRRVVVSAANLEEWDQLRLVNRFYNEWPYKTDKELHGHDEYLASTLEFIRESGDCEDYVIAKYVTLRQLGFADHAIRIVIVEDGISGLRHSVLVVRWDDDFVVLDNLSDELLSHTQYRYYSPLYSVNETAWWLHVTYRATRTAAR